MQLKIYTEDHDQEIAGGFDSANFKEAVGLFLKSPLEDCLSFDKLSPLVQMEQPHLHLGKLSVHSDSTTQPCSAKATVAAADLSNHGTTPIAVKAPWTMPRSMPLSRAPRAPSPPIRNDSSGTLVDSLNLSPLSPLVCAGKPPTPHSSQTRKASTVQQEGPVFCLWNNPDGRCRGVFANYDGLWEHITQDHIGYARLGTICLQCRWDDCHEPPKRKRDHMLSHMRRHLPKYRPFVCPLCDEGRHRYHELNKHMLKLHGISAKDALPAPRKRTTSHEPLSAMQKAWGLCASNKRVRSVSFHPYSNGPAHNVGGQSLVLFDGASRALQQHAPTPQITPRMDNGMPPQTLYVDGNRKFEKVRRYSSSSCIVAANRLELHRTSNQPLSLLPTSSSSFETTPVSEADMLPSPTPSLLPMEQTERHLHQRSKSFGQLRLDVAMTCGLNLDLSKDRYDELKVPSAISPSAVSPLLWLGQKKEFFQ